MTKIIAFTESFTNANILTVTVGSNCPQGGDSGHGGRTLFRLFDEAATAWSVKIDDTVIDQPQSIEIVLGGDTEAETFANCLEFAAKVLRGQIGPGMGMEGVETRADFH